MSFSSETKKELYTLPLPRSKCCRRAFCAGLLYDADSDGAERTVASFGTRETADYVCRTVNTVFSRSGGHAPVGTGLSGYDVAFASGEIAATVNGSCENFVQSGCGECVQYFVRGLFIACANLTDPNNQYHLEYSVLHHERVAAVSDLLEACIGRPTAVKRRNRTGLVYKSSVGIEDTLSLIGATQSYFNLINNKIERELRNNANRATNCETRNIASSVEAAKRQTEAIERLKRAGELEKLSPELNETAQLRLLYPDLPLSELASRHCPPISKSGINHRITKLLDAASRI